MDIVARDPANEQARADFYEYMPRDTKAVHYLLCELPEMFLRPAD